MAKYRVIAGKHYEVQPDGKVFVYNTGEIFESDRVVSSLMLGKLEKIVEEPVVVKSQPTPVPTPAPIVDEDEDEEEEEEEEDEEEEEEKPAPRKTATRSRRGRR